jgi:coatomer subunit beta'
LAWRNKAFGTGTSFAWANDSNTYAVQESKNKIRVYRNFKERTGFIKGGSAGIAVEAIYGGTLLGARGSGYVLFWDWETGELVRRIEVEATSVSFPRQSHIGIFPTQLDNSFRSRGPGPATWSPLPALTRFTFSNSTVTHTTRH